MSSINNSSPMQTTYGSFTRFLDDASGSVTITGLPFRPKFIFFHAVVGTSGSVGWALGASSQGMITRADSFTNSQVVNGSCIGYKVAADQQYGAIDSLTDDGFTVAWTHAGAGAHTQFTVYYIAIG